MDKTLGLSSSWHDQSHGSSTANLLSLANAIMSDFSARLETVSQGPEYYISQQSLRAKDDLIEDLQGQIAKLNQELKTIKSDKVLRRDQIYALKAEARSYQEELGKSNSKPRI